MSDPAGILALIEAIKHMHGCGAEHVGSERVTERSPTGETVWDGDVEAFRLSAHPKAQLTYAWSEATMAQKRRFFAVLGLRPVTNAARAVQASIISDSK